MHKDREKCKFVFLQVVFWLASRTLGYGIQFSQVLAVFYAQYNSTSDNKDDLNNEPSTSEMSRKKFASPVSRSWKI
jgi:hypothetical protein